MDKPHVVSALYISVYEVETMEGEHGSYERTRS